MSRIYFAGPLFNAGEKEFNARVVQVLERAGYSVFLPQRDGMLAAELAGLTQEQKVSRIFEKDVSELRGADLLVMVLDGRVPDEGACVELGIAYQLGKRCYGIKSDVRSLEDGLDINPLLAGCFVRVFENPDADALLGELENFLKTHTL